MDYKKCSDPNTESPKQKDLDFSMGGAYVSQSDPNNNSGDFIHSGQNVNG